MPGGGKLTIETANASISEDYAADVPAGQYVMIAITDTGCGMTPDTIDGAFEPFFTTKDVGKGSGLGLSQVYGFVKQSSGHVKIYSEIDHGTTVKIYLPRFAGKVDSTPGLRGAISLHAARPIATGQEIILVVEDEERVRQLTVEALTELGYTVLQAGDAAAALRILDLASDITLLFTDIVMPGMNGRKLADEALLRRPMLKVLYTTGYTRNAIIHNGVLDVGVHLVSKPFSLEQLATKVRAVLDGAI
jgi:CheY-like chemotaxis protein